MAVPPDNRLRLAALNTTAGLVCVRGAMVAVRSTLPMKPLTLASVIPTVVEVPRFMDKLLGPAEALKSAGGATFVNSKTRLLNASPTQRLPEESNAKPVGPQSPLCVVEHVLVVKPDWPITSDALSPFEKGGVNSSTRLLDASVTQRLPEESNAMASGPQSPLCVVEHVPVVKLDWPITSDALSPFEKGGVNSSTRALDASATQRLPEESNAEPSGLQSPLCVVEHVPVVKLDWPITRDAD